MRTHDEQHLVRIANDYINRLRHEGEYFPHGLGFNHEHDFFMSTTNARYSHRDTILGFMSKMGDDTLGTIFGLGIVTCEQRKKSHFRQTRRLVGPGTVSFDAVSGSGHDILVSLAFSVVLPAMYDILHAERVILEKEAQVFRDTHEKSTTPAYSSWPKPAMKKFVREYRLKK